MFPIVYGVAAYVGLPWLRDTALPWLRQRLGTEQSQAFGGPPSAPYDPLWEARTRAEAAVAMAQYSQYLERTVPPEPTPQVVESTDDSPKIQGNDVYPCRKDSTE